MRPIKITRNILDEFFDLVKGGMSQSKAAAHFEMKPESFRKAAERMGVEWIHRKKGPKAKILSRKEEIINSSKSQGDWAKEFGTTQAYISHLFADSGIREKRLKARHGEHATAKTDVARKVIGYIAENGGHVIDALKALGINCSQPQYIRDFAKMIGFDLKHYFYAWRTYGYWMTIPGPVRPLAHPANVMVPAICTLCCNIKELHLTNAKSGRTHKCNACVTGKGKLLGVENTETGEMYRSINAFVQAHGLSGRYQQTRLVFVNEGKFVHHGIEYKLTG